MKREHLPTPPLGEGAPPVAGYWTPARPLRRATWLEVVLDRWIGDRHGRPGPSVLRGLARR